jgi:glutamyl-tRNA reductase
MLVVVGTSHKLAPVALREQLNFAGDALEQALDGLRSLPTLGEVMLLSTCNRTEVYASSDKPEATQAAIHHFLSEARQVPAERLAPYLYDYAGDSAIRHLLRVAASLDSMVVGEPQILGQVKAAYGTAARLGTVGPLLGNLLPRAFGVAKRVRSETDIARHPASVPAVAVDLARRIFGDLSGATILCVGAGKMSNLAAKRLRAAGAAEILVTNRSPERAADLARLVGGRTRPWEELQAALSVADVVVSSTGASEPVLDIALVSRAVKARKQRPLFLIDIAVPRDIAPDVARLPNVYLYDLDDLQRVVADGLKERRTHAQDAERIIESELAGIVAWSRGQGVVPTIKRLRQKGDSIARAEVEKAFQRLRSLGATDTMRPALDALADAVVGKLLHGPTVALKQGATSDDGWPLVDAARRLFALDDTAPTEVAAPDENREPGATEPMSEVKAR